MVCNNKDRLMIDDSYLVKRCLERDRRCQRLLYEKYASLMLGVLMRYAGSRAEAEDILQEGFVKAFMNMKQYAGTGSFSGWLKSIMINTAITHFHRNKYLREQDPIDNVGEGNLKDHGEVSGLERLKEDDLLKVITGLPPGFRVVFNLYAIEGYKHHEIAEMLNIDEGTSKSQYSRARKLIRERLGKRQ